MSGTDADLSPMWRAPGIVRDRLIRAVRALESAGLPYAVAGGHAVAYWVATVDEGAVRNTPDVNILVAPHDRTRAGAALLAVGFVVVPTDAGKRYVDAPGAKATAGVSLFAFGERIGTTDVLPAPETEDSVHGTQFRVVTLEPLVRMKLVAHRLKDRVHIRDLIGVGLIDEAWPAKFPPPLDERLRAILAYPDG